MSTSPASPSRGFIRGICLVLFLGTLALFSRAVGHDFVNYDDPDYVTKNEWVRSGLSGAGIHWAFAFANISYWHPLTWLSHMLDWSLFGPNPHGHHATSVLIHALNAVLAFAALRRLTNAPWPSAFCAALFAWHPLRVESVAWVAERKDVLSGLFFFLTIWAYAAYAEKRRTHQPAATRLYVLTLAAYAGGLMSKPMLVSVPGLLLLLDFWPLQRFASRPSPERPTAPTERLPGLLAEKLPFVGLAAAVSLITYFAQEQVGTLTHLLSFPARLANAAVAIASYLGLFFWPFKLSVLYPHPGMWPAANILGAVTVILAVTAIALVQRRRRPWLLAGWLWFLGMLIPVLGLVQVGIQSMADRYTYLPELGLALALAWTAREFTAQPTARRAVVAGAVLALLGCAVRTWDQLGVWQDSGTLFTQAIHVTKNNYLAYDNLGTHVFDQGRIDEAIAYHRESLAIQPNYELANNNLGNALTRRGQPAEAIPYFQAALRSKPGLLEAHNNLGNALVDIGRMDEALVHFEFVLARRPADAEALNNYGVALARKGRPTEAIDRFQAALRSQPNHAAAHSNLGNVYAILGRPDDALGEYRAALALNPGDARTLNNLGNIYFQKGEFNEAAGRYEKALGIEPVNPEAHANYGLALARLGRRAEAIQHLTVALQQRPDYAEAQRWLNALQPPVPAPK